MDCRGPSHSGGLFTRAQLCFHRQMNRCQTLRVLQAWTTRELGAATTQVAALRQAIADADRDTVERHGGLGAALKKINQLKQETPALNGQGMIDDFRLWGSRRCRQTNAPPKRPRWRV